MRLRLFLSFLTACFTAEATCGFFMPVPISR